MEIKLYSSPEAEVLELQTNNQICETSPGGTEDPNFEDL